MTIDREALAALEFPSVFPLKAIGWDTDDFEAFVVSIVRKHVAIPAELIVTSRPSRGGRYLAVTVTFTAQSWEQLDALYLELNQSTRVLMTL